MSTPISFSDSNNNIQGFLMIYFKFLVGFLKKENIENNFFIMDKSLSESFLLVRNIIFYYQFRDLLIDDINIHNNIIIENENNISHLPILLSSEDNELYKNIELLSGKLLYKVFSIPNYVICTKDSKPSKPWINSNISQMSFYDY